jgi:hypothetical protein
MLLRKILLSAVISVFAALGAFAQSTTSSSSTPTRTMENTVQDFDRMQALSEQLHESTIFSDRKKSIAPVLGAITQFRKATGEFRDAVGAKTDVRDVVRDIEKLMKPFDDYFEDMKLKAPPLDIADFKDYSSNDIIWEALTTAERIDNNLQRSLFILRDAERSGAITIQAMQFMNGIQSDMIRFKWLAAKVDTIRRLTD